MSNNIIIGDVILKEVKDYKYLGIKICNSGSFQIAREHLYKVSMKAMGNLKKCFDTSLMSIKSALYLFDSLIEPILLYGCEVTNFIHITESLKRNNYSYMEKMLNWPQERVHINFCRFLLGVNNKTTKIAVLSELGRYPLYIKAFKQMWKYIVRCENEKEGSLLYNAYHESKNIESGLSWVNSFNYILKKSGLSDDDHFGGFSIKTIDELFKSSYRQYWKEKIFDDSRKENYGNKLRTYRKFKIVYELEPFLKTIKNSEHCKQLCRLRISNHSLMIEKGRHMRLLVEDRLCKVCKVIEDEQHFISDCKINQNLRKSLFKFLSTKSKHFFNLTSEQKLIFMMSVSDEESIIKISNFVYNSFKIRENMYEGA